MKILLLLSLLPALSFATTDTTAEEEDFLNPKLEVIGEAPDGLKVIKPVQKNSLPASKYENPTNKPIRMPHPRAEQGLTRIQTDKKHIYEVLPKESKRSTSVKFGIYSPNDLENPDNTAVSFTDIYEDREAPIVLVDMEWILSNKLGRSLFQVGTGVYTASGKGRFKETPTRQARERFTFVTIPITANYVYQARYWPGQWILPYGGGGLGVMSFAELRDDDKGPKFGGAGIAQGFAGAAVSISSISREVRLQMAQDYGINNVWFAVEYRLFAALSDKFDFSGDVISAGFNVEY